jgi:hypothetical protein
MDMKTGKCVQPESRGSKPGETPGTTAWMACTPEGCQRGSPVFWHPSGVPLDTPPN